MSEPSEPTPEAPRREFRFKSAEFERTNRPLDEDDHLPAIDARTIARQAHSMGDPPPVAPEPPKENEVHEILRANLERANELGLNDVDLTPRPPSRRKVDYWTLMIVGNLGFAGLALLLSRNVVTLVFAGSGMVLFSLGVTWILWFVMDNY